MGTKLSFLKLLVVFLLNDPALHRPRRNLVDAAAVPIDLLPKACTLAWALKARLDGLRWVCGKNMY